MKTSTLLILLACALLIPAVVLTLLAAFWLYAAKPLAPAPASIVIHSSFPPAPAPETAPLPPAPEIEKPFTPIRPEFARVPQPDGATRVYFSDFTSKPGTEWSDTPIKTTPKGKRPYLGGFVQEPVDFEIDKLPPHKLVRVTLDLFLLRSWDGSSKTWGEKIFDIDVLGKQNLLHTSFSNCGFFSDNNEQAFPDSFPCRPHPAWTGASEKQTLGTMQSWGGKDRTFDTSSVYHLVLTFPHSDPDLALSLQATMRKNHDKSWGLGSFKIETLPDFLTLPETDLPKLWQNLADVDATIAFAAQWKLIASPNQSVPFLAEHLNESIDATPEQIQSWIDELLAASDSKAANLPFNNLIFQGRNAEGAILPITTRTDLPPDARYRFSTILYWLRNHPETPTELRLHRTKQLLNIINSPDSTKLAATIPDHEGDTGRKKKN